MSSINPHFTLQYSQPEEYRFSHDSNFLAREVYELINNEKLKYNSILDLCAGCGVVGIDLAFHLLQNGLHAPARIDFIEIQEIYRSHFLTNVDLLETQFSKNIVTNFINANYNSLRLYSPKYDVIVSNPPYFRIGNGLLSKSDFKNRCRFFIDSDFNSLIQAINYSLKPTGQAFVLIKSLTEHGIDVQDEFHKLNFSLSLEKFKIIRDTDLYRIRFKSQKF